MSSTAGEGEGLGEGEGEGDSDGVGDLWGRGEWVWDGEGCPIDADGDADPFVSLPPSNTAMAMMISKPTSTMLPEMIHGPLDDRCCGMDRG